ncbi:MAG: hypothetical protein ACLQQB_08450 [Solirubrobacteraceae bacterium]
MAITTKRRVLKKPKR